MEISLLHSLPLFQGVDLESIGEILTVLHSVEAGYPGGMYFTTSRRNHFPLWNPSGRKD